jgi:hypothetical protein
MPNNDATGSKGGTGADWSKAWEAVVRLAVAQESLHEVGKARHAASSQQASIIAQATRAEPARAKPVAPAALPASPTELDQLAGAVAEIEKASAALRRSEPGLEVGLPSTDASMQARRYRSVWILIGALWISATLVVASATGAILYVFG